ncbi:transposon Tf2-11 type 2, partial [Puccinia sorghi]
DYFILKNDLLLYKEKIVVPDNPSLKLSILESRHDSPLAGHFGQEKTYSCYKLFQSRLFLGIPSLWISPPNFLSDLFIEHVFSKHGLPDNIVSN